MDLARKLVPLALAGLTTAGYPGFSPAASATSTFLECNPSVHVTYYQSRPACRPPATEFGGHCGGIRPVATTS